MAGADAITRAARELVRRESPLVLAVSGGIDSMTLLDAVARAEPRRGRLVVATFDHGTGPAARRSARLVRDVAQSLGLPVRVGRTSLPEASEAEWRAARLGFLRTVAAEEQAVLVTGHTRDDQLETVVMRILRGTGVRGLAGLLEPAGVARPLLPCSRAEVRRYAEIHALRWIEDPTNASRTHFRNRVRLDILPALLAARPALAGELLALALDASRVRSEIDELARGITSAARDGETRVDLSPLEGMPEDGARLIWQSVVSASGAPVNWRGTVALSRLGRHGRVGARCQISGGIEAIRERRTLVLRPVAGRDLAPAVALSGDTTFGSWRFRREPEATIRKLTDGRLPADPWLAALPAGSELTVRSWVPGDRMGPAGDRSARRVKRFFADARIAGPRRAGWPVVVVRDRIVWIPGVKRSPSADRMVPGSTIIYRCERQPG
jgi:tRNA(Ile)-lysidine synthase